MSERPHGDDGDADGDACGTRSDRPHPTRTSLIMRSLRRAADALLPPLCLGCHEPMADHHTLCPTCWSKVDFIRPPLCDRLGTPMPFDTGGAMISAAAAADPPIYQRARAVARFDGLVRDLIHDLKFRDLLTGLPLFGRWMAEAGRELLADADAVVPVPMARLRLISRRYNQSALLAKEIAHLSGVPHMPMLLVRTRRTRPQVGLSARERKANVKNAFAVPPRQRGWVQGRRIVLIDDVITSGATADAAAAALIAAGAARVDVLALARVADVALVPS